jgi:hypothetical protein
MSRPASPWTPIIKRSEAGALHKFNDVDSYLDREAKREGLL